MLSNINTMSAPQKNITFKALPTKVCGFCKPEDVGIVLDAAMQQRHPNLILGLLISLQHYALKGLSLNDKEAGSLLTKIREGSFERNTPVKIACVTHCKKADELLGHVRGIYEKAFDGATGLKKTAARISHNFSVDSSRLLRGFDIVQIHDDMPLEEVEEFSKRYADATGDIFKAPIPKIIKAIHVPKQGDSFNREDLQKYALEYAVSKHVNGEILDSSNLARDQIGGTGLTNDWNVARSLIETIHKKTGKPVGLAGGICPSNTQQAIEKVRPDFIDGNTGFRHDRPDKPQWAKWNPLQPGICPPKDGSAVAEILRITSDVPSTSFYDKHMTL